MHNNYYFLRQLNNQLQYEFASFKIGEIYSQAKNELIISMYRGDEERCIKAHLSPQFCCLSFPQEFSRARKNSVDLFHNIHGLEIIDIIQIDNDRSFYFKFRDSYKLLFKMHGNRSNIILIQGQEVIELFKHKLKQDYHIKLDKLVGHFSFDKGAFKALQGNWVKLIPTLGKSFASYFKERNYEALGLDEKYRCLIDLLDYLKHPDFYIHNEKHALPRLSLYRIHPQDEKMESPVDAINTFYNKYIYTYQIEKEKSELRNSITAGIRKGESYILNSISKLKKLQLTTNYKHIGDLIMANLHQIKPHDQDIVVTDFYSGKPVKIQLKSTLSPQLNAEKYYKKAKNQRIEIETLINNIKQKKAEIDDLKFEVNELEKLTEVKQLRKKKKLEVKTEDPPYHVAYFMNYEIQIGKNAVKNEQLTFNYAKKDDLFLHVKDMPGSHVIIKKKSNQNIPQAVIEKAAAFAAYYSKNKSKGLCSVLYTPKKYVRKAKGKPAGTVLVQREKVLLVIPENIKGFIGRKD